MKAPFFAVAIALLMALPVTVRAAAPPTYAYDSFAPLDLSIDDSVDAGTVRVARISYRSQTDLIHATLVSPKDAGVAMPGVVFVPDVATSDTDDSATFLEDAKWLARRGVVSLLPSEPWSSPDWLRSARANDTDVRDTVAGVIALRRGLDVLASREGVDKMRFAFVGHGIGALFGVLLASVDARPTTYVFMSPDTSFAQIFERDTSRPPSDRAAYEAKLSVFAVAPALARSSFTAALLQFGLQDREISKADAMTFSDNVPGTNTSLRFYPTGHALATDAATDERRLWLAARFDAR